MKAEHLILKNMKSKEIAKGVILRSAHLSKLTVTFVELANGAKVPLHSHPHEQISFIVKGKLKLTVDSIEYEVGPSEALTIPAGAPHSAEVIEGPVFVVDSFSPKREDYVF